MIVLDTHAWIWYASESPELSADALEAIEADDERGICALSCWEVAMLVAKQRLALSLDVDDWIARALERPGFRILPVDPRIAVLSTRLPGNIHGDPVDRLIGATCLAHNAPLVTKDKRLTEWGQIPVIW